MAVLRRSYRRYDGPSTPTGWRFLVVARFAALELTQTRPLTAVLVASYVPLLAHAALIYLVNNPAASLLLGLSGRDVAGWVDAGFFLRVLGIQGFIAFVIATWVGPGLVAPDLANGALPLYLSRPLSRAEYVGGKMTLLAGLLSMVTWVPLLLLVALQASLADGWLSRNVHIATGLWLGSLLWIFVLALLTLALSAWVRWRLAAGVAMCAIFFVGSGIGEAWVNVMDNPWGRVANLSYAIAVVWRDLLHVAARADRFELPVWAAWTSLLATCALSLWLLDRRVRAKEVVR